MSKMVKTNISLAEQLKRVTQTVGRMVDNGDGVSAIERAILLDALQDMYETVLSLPLAERKEAVVLQQHTADIREEQIDKHQVQEYDGLVKEASLKSMPESSPLCLGDGSTIAEDKPQFAFIPEEEEPTFHQPSMEEVEGSGNDELFEDSESDEAAALKEEARKKAEAAAARKRAEEEEARKKAEAAAARKRAEEELARKKAEEEKARAAINKKAKENEEKADNAESSLFDLLSKSRATESSVASTETAHKTLGEKLIQPTLRVEDEVENQMKRHKVSDMRTLININDKFSFMSELFHNNMKAYNDFILRLNATDDRDQALNYVNEMAQQYHWDNESLAVKTFYSIFDRKF